MRYAILGAIPLPVLVWALWPAPAPLVPVMVATEGVRAQRQDEGTFKVRWTSVNELPPAVVTRIDPGREQRAAAGVLPADAPSGASSSTRRRFVVHRVRLDVCTRHGMRKVHYGKRWRCRK